MACPRVVDGRRIAVNIPSSRRQPTRGDLRTCYEMLHGASELAVSCEHGNETSGSIKGGEFLDQLSDYWFLKKDSTPWS
jgi:hypothetical protein